MEENAKAVKCSHVSVWVFGNVIPTLFVGVKHWGIGVRKVIVQAKLISKVVRVCSDISFIVPVKTENLS